MKKNKSILLIGLLITLVFNPPPINAGYCLITGCPDGKCDDVIDCAMETQRKALEARLDDLIHTIEANTKQTKHQTKIIEQEVLAYNRLLERVKQESLSLKEAVYLTKKIKKSESLGITLDTIKKGKE